jgi:hypothetical protein
MLSSFFQVFIVLGLYSFEFCIEMSERKKTKRTAG